MREKRNIMLKDMPFDKMTRKKQVAELLKKNNNVAEIANILNISEKSVIAYMKK